MQNGILRALCALLLNPHSLDLYSPDFLHSSVTSVPSVAKFPLGVFVPWWLSGHSLFRFLDFGRRTGSVRANGRKAVVERRRGQPGQGRPRDVAAMARALPAAADVAQAMGGVREPVFFSQSLPRGGGHVFRSSGGGARRIEPVLRECVGGARRHRHVQPWP